MLADKYEEIIHNSEVNQAKEEGEQRILKLANAMLENNQIEDIKRLQSDKKFLEEMLEKYHID